MKKLQDLRRDAGLTQTELAQRAHLSRTIVNRIERGRAKPSMSTIIKLACALGVSTVTVWQALADDLEGGTR